MTDSSDRGSLGRSAARGVLVTSSGQAARLGLQLAGVVILSRMLDPSDFGVLAMITAIVTVGQSIRDFGLSNASIQSRELTGQQRSNLFWLNTGLGIVTAAALFFLAPALAAFYSTPILTPVSQALALTFLLNGLMTQSRAHLARRLRFGQLMVTDLLPAALGLAIAVATAAAGAGVWALVAQQVAIALFGLLFSVGFDRWIPGLPGRAPNMGYFLRYGMYLTLSQVVATLSRNADYVILGYRYGSVPTGFYNRAFELVINPLNQVNAPSSKVAVPVLSRLQDDKQRFDEFLLAGQKAMLVILVPILAAGATLGLPLVLLVLGEQWEPSAPLLQILAIAGICRAASYATYWVALSKGATKVSLWVNLVSAPVLVLCIAVGSIWEAAGVAWGFAAGTALTWGIALVWYSKAADAPGLRMFKSACVVISASIIPSLAAGGSLLVTSALLPVLQVLIGLVVFALVWFASVMVVPAFKRDLRTVLRMAKLVGPRRAGG